MNMFKKNGGFTLVELIVVIAILAILAGVAVPAYSGYINRANEAADITALDSVKTAVVAVKYDTSITAIYVKDGAVYFNEAKAANALSDLTPYYDISTIDLKSDTYANGAKWTSVNGWEAWDGTVS